MATVRYPAVMISGVIHMRAEEICVCQALLGQALIRLTWQQHGGLIVSAEPGPARVVLIRACFLCHEEDHVDWGIVSHHDIGPA